MPSMDGGSGLDAEAELEWVRRDDALRWMWQLSSLWIGPYTLLVLAATYINWVGNLFFVEALEVQVGRTGLLLAVAIPAVGGLTLGVLAAAVGRAVTARAVRRPASTSRPLGSSTTGSLGALSAAGVVVTGLAVIFVVVS